MAMAMIMFAFGGIELVGIAAAETDNPQKLSQKPSIKLFTASCYFIS